MPSNLSSRRPRDKLPVSNMSSKDPVVLDEVDLYRPPYVGIRKAAPPHGGSTTQPKTSTASASPSPANGRPCQPSAYVHWPFNLPVKEEQPSDRPQSADMDTTWQPVCKPGEEPTEVCGKYSSSQRDPPEQPQSRGGGGPFKCPRCGFGCSRKDALRRHFPPCIEKNGNPDCDAWTDHDSLATKERRTMTVHHVELKAWEYDIRRAAHKDWACVPLEVAARAEGQTGPETPEEVAKASKAIASNLKEDIDMRDADDISPEEDRVTKCFKKDGIWASESSDKA